MLMSLSFPGVRIALVDKLSVSIRTDGHAVSPTTPDPISFFEIGADSAAYVTGRKPVKISQIASTISFTAIAAVKMSSAYGCGSGTASNRFSTIPRTIQATASRPHKDSQWGTNLDVYSTQ